MTLLLLDFSSTFDCVDHSILLKVLELQFGITASTLLWIANFLTNPIVYCNPKTITIMQHNYISDKFGNKGKPKSDAEHSSDSGLFTDLFWVLILWDGEPKAFLKAEVLL